MVKHANANLLKSGGTDIHNPVRLPMPFAGLVSCRTQPSFVLAKLIDFINLQQHKGENLESSNCSVQIQAGYSNQILSAGSQNERGHFHWRVDSGKNE